MYQTTIRKRRESFGDVWIVVDTDDFGMNLSRRQKEDLGAPPKTWEQSLQKDEFDIWVSNWEEEQKPQALERKPSLHV